MPEPTTPSYSALVAAADEAYADARALVFDRLPVGVEPDDADLDPAQRAALIRLGTAERELTAYRDAHQVPAPRVVRLPGQPGPG